MLNLKTLYLTIYNSVLSYKGGKKILCTHRRERVRKNDFTHEWPKSSAFALLFGARVHKIVFMHELAMSAKNFRPCSLSYFVRFLCSILIN